MPDLEPFRPDVELVALARANDWERRELEWGALLRKAGIAGAGP